MTQWETSKTAIGKKVYLKSCKTGIHNSTIYKKIETFLLQREAITFYSGILRNPASLTASREWASLFFSLFKG